MNVPRCNRAVLPVNQSRKLDFSRAIDAAFSGKDALFEMETAFDFVLDDVRDASNTALFNKSYALLGNLAESLRQPWPCDVLAKDKMGSCTHTNTTAVMEMLFRQAVHVIQAIPLMENVDPLILRRIIKEKFFGVLLLLVAFIYKKEDDSVSVRVMQNPYTRNVITMKKPLKDYLEHMLFFLQYQDAEKLAVHLDTSKSLLCTLEHLYKSPQELFACLSDVFEEQAGEACLALIGIYIFRDYPSTVVQHRHCYDLFNYMLLQRTYRQPSPLYLSRHSRFFVLLSDLTYLELCLRQVVRVLPSELMNPLLREVLLL